ncbi:MAG: VTT domain-containing protein [Planctomycetota bacterium]
MPSTSLRRRQTFARIIVVIAFVVCVLVALQFGREDLTRLVNQYGWFAPMISVPVHAMVAATPFPSDVIVIANGAVFGYPVAVLLSWIGWYLGSILEFHGVRVARGRADEDGQAVSSVGEDAANQMQRAPSWLRRLPVGSPWFLILGRQIPWGGAHFTIIPAAAAGVPWRRFLWCSAIAVVPGALLLPAIGAKLWPS